MICFPNAKINLGLHIVSRRPDGYHNIETVFYPVPLYDVLEIVPSETGETTFSQTGIPVDGNPGDNLVMKAFRLLEKDFKLSGINIYLRKQIPFGAGLGGGSSDAAFMLKLLNDFAALGLSVEQLEKYARQLGADCPFFIRNRPVFAEGVGDIFTPVNISLKGYYFVVAQPPGVHVSTKEAYAGVKPKQPAFRLSEINALPLNEWKNHITNDFEETIFTRYPAIANLKQALYDEGAIYASMSGSGSSVFAIFKKQLRTTNYKKQLRIANYELRTAAPCHSREGGNPP